MQPLKCQMDGLDVPVREPSRGQRSQASTKEKEAFFHHQREKYGCRRRTDRFRRRQEGRGATSPAPCAVPSRRRGLYAKCARGPMRVSDSHCRFSATGALRIAEKGFFAAWVCVSALTCPSGKMAG